MIVLFYLSKFCKRQSENRVKGSDFFGVIEGQIMLIRIFSERQEHLYNRIV